MNDRGEIVRNKTRLVVKEYAQEEGIDFDETVVSVTKLESIRMFLAYACYKGFKLFQIDVKSFFFNDFIDEKVYVEQAPNYKNKKFQIMFSNLQRRYMVWNKFQGFGTKG